MVKFLEIIKNHPLGLFLVIILLSVMFIYRGIIKCFILMLIRLPFNINRPDKILAEGICDPNKIFQVQVGVGIMDFINKHQIFTIIIILLSIYIFIYFKFKKSKNNITIKQ